MRATWTTMVIALAMAAPVAAQDHARERGGSSGSSSSSAGERHHSSPPSSSGGVSSQSSSSSGGGGSFSGAYSGPATDAQRRHPRPGTGTGDRWGRSGDGRWSSPYYRSYWGGSYYDPFWYGYWGYSPWYSGAYYYGGGYYDRYYGYGSGYAPYRSYGRDQGALRIIVDPDKTRVYVDGYYAGIADDFDGIFQRLYLPPGRHEISLKLEGYQTHRFRVYVPYDQTIKIHHVMVRGSGESEDVVGSPLDDDRARAADLDRDRERDADTRERDREADRRWRRDAPQTMEDDRDNADAGTLRLDVRPQDASVYVDGQFRGSGRQVERLRLAVGPHRVEIVRPGYRTVEREVEVRAGETKDLEVELAK